MAEQLAFTQLVEGLIRAMGDKLDERAHRKFEALGLPMRGKLQATYPRELFTKAALLAGELLSPHLPPEQQRLELGKRFVKGYSETMVGKALLGLMRVLGTRKSLERMEKNFHTGNNYSRAKLIEEPDGLYMLISDVQYPEWYQGMVQEALTVTGAKDGLVTFVKREGNEVLYRIQYR